MAEQSMHQEQFGHVTRIMRREKKKKRRKDTKIENKSQHAKLINTIYAHPIRILIFS